ncbi:MAG: TadE/TadG family type IV pilus assembly protein [Chloroflexota bacterium]
MVELAIILPVLIVLVLGVIDLGRVFYAYEAMANATREGARYCALHTGDEAGTRARIQGEINGWVQLTVTSTTCPTPGAGQPLTVTATSTFDPLTPLIESLTGATITLTTSATMVQWQ